jgi:arylsulfatase A-like enzyme
MIKKQLLFLSISLLFFNWNCAFQKGHKKEKAPNILFIAIDDLRPQLNCYGEKYMHTPHLDQLAAEGQLFNNHFVQVPTCGASRYALLLGQYPQYRKHLGNNVFVNQLVKEEQAGLHTLPKAFKNAGYYTASIGKVSHYVDGKIYTYDGKGDGRPEMPGSWDYEWGPTGKWGTAWNAFFAYADGSNRNTRKKEVPPMEFTAEKDEDLPDGLIAAEAKAQLNKLKDQSQPFFLAVGFFKPHLPFNAPKKYWDLYEEKDLPLSPTPNMPQNIPAKAIPTSGELFNSYKIQPEKGGRGIRVSDEYALQLRRAYYAAVSYADAQVGKVLQTLKETGLDKNTIVIVWGDHGWHLGDHTTWGKHTLFERSLKSTLMIKTPDKKRPKGILNKAVVETVDLYPTLLELCQIPNPNKLSGESLVPLLNNPTLASKKPSLSFWNNGYSIRTPQYRLTKYKINKKVHTVLYDHQKDPYEANNLANEAAYNAILKDLEKQLVEKSPATFWESL